MRATVIVIDLDGTLADTSRDLLPVLNRTIGLEGLPPVAAPDVGHWFGQGAKSMIARAFALNARPLEPAVHDRLLDAFLADYEANLSAETVMFDGALEAMDALAAQGATLAICTNKMERMAVKLLGELGVRQRFAAVTGGDTFAFRKPDPRHLIETLRGAGGDPARALMVGDSRTDIDTARAAGVPVVAVDFGYSDVPVASLAPDIVISHFAELPDAARRLLAPAPAQ